MLAIEKITPSIGAEVSGIDLSQDIPPVTWQKLHQDWLKHKLLVFRNQELTPDQQLTFTCLFGEVDKYPFLDGITGNPFVAPVLKLPNETVNFGGVWHSDTSYLECPAAGASLYAVELPETGGDTIFCNMGAAYRALPETTRDRIRQLTAINSSAKPAIAKTRINRTSDKTANSDKPFYQYEHPVVRTHPQSGEQTLYVNEAHTVSIVGLEESEGTELLNFLFEHARKPEFQCRLRWKPGTLALWDNRSTHHYPVNDYNGFRRLLHRVSLRGNRPV